MKLYFKSDKTARLWLVACTELKIKKYNNKKYSREDEEMTIKMIAWPTPKQKGGLMQKFKINRGLSLMKKMESAYCPICLVRTTIKYPILLYMLMEVNYKTDEQLMTIFKRIWTDITPEQLESLKTSKGNRELSVDICPECYIEATDNIGVNGINKFTKG